MAGETPLTLVGNVTADPEVRYSQSGKPVVNFTVASNETRFDRATNEWKPTGTLYLPCHAWNEFAENIANTLTKGMRVIVKGNLKQRQYETREGERRTIYELDVLEVGPSLRYATAQVTRNARNDAPQASQGDSWATATPGNADAWATPGADRAWPSAPTDDETPF